MKGMTRGDRAVAEACRRVMDDGNESAVPAWRIDYTTNETDVTNLRAIYIDAVSGFEVN